MKTITTNVKEDKGEIFFYFEIPQDVDGFIKKLEAKGLKCIGVEEDSLVFRA